MVDFLPQSEEDFRFSDLAILKVNHESLDQLFADPSAHPTLSCGHALKLALRGSIPEGKTWRDNPNYNQFIRDILTIGFKDKAREFQDLDLSTLLIRELETYLKTYHPCYEIGIDFKYSAFPELGDQSFFVKFFPDTERGEKMQDRELRVAQYLQEKGLPVLRPEVRTVNCDLDHDSPRAETCLRDQSTNHYTGALIYEHHSSLFRTLIQGGQWDLEMKLAGKKVRNRCLKKQEIGFHYYADYSDSYFKELLNIMEEHRWSREEREELYSLVLDKVSQSVEILPALNELDINDFSAKTGAGIADYGAILVEATPSEKTGRKLLQYVQDNYLPRVQELSQDPKNLTVCHGDFTTSQILQDLKRFFYVDWELAHVGLCTDDVIRMAYDRKLLSIFRYSFGRVHASNLYQRFQHDYSQRAAAALGFDAPEDQEKWNEMLAYSGIVNSLTYLGNLSQKAASESRVDGVTERVGVSVASLLGTLESHAAALEKSGKITSRLARGLVQKAQACYGSLLCRSNQSAK